MPGAWFYHPNSRSYDPDIGLYCGLSDRTWNPRYPNPRYPFRRELRALLGKALGQLPASERKRYFTERRRPRRTGKPLLSRKPRVGERTSLEDLAALVCTTLEAHGISVVLSGGAVVSIYSDAEYVRGTWIAVDADTRSTRELWIC